MASIGLDSLSELYHDNTFNYTIIDFWNATPHLETSFEIVINLLKSQRHVTYINVGSWIALAECYSIHNSDYQRTLSSLASAYSGFSDLSKHVECLFSESIYNPPKMQCPHTLDSLLKLEYLGINIGWGVYSNASTLLGTSDFSTIYMSGTLDALCRNSVQAIHVMQYLNHRYDDLTVIHFNGRYSFSWSAIGYCNKMSIKSYIHERAGSPEKYYLGRTLPHNYKNWASALNKCLALPITDPQIAKLRLSGQKWLQLKLNRSDLNIINPGKNQKKGLQLPFDTPKKLRVSYFSVSMDEWHSLPPDVFPVSSWTDEFSALQCLGDALAKFSNVSCIVRIHPHLHTKHRIEKQRWDLFHHHNLHLISHDSEIDTYDLISSSDLVLTFGSTVALEALCLGKPVAIFGRTYYDQLPNIYNIRKREDLHCLLNALVTGTLSQPSSKPPYHEVYCGLRATHGIPYKFFKSLGLNNGTFAGIQTDYPAC
jgi:hypothetical protein